MFRTQGPGSAKCGQSGSGSPRAVSERKVTGNECWKQKHTEAERAHTSLKGPKGDVVCYRYCWGNVTSTSKTGFHFYKVSHLKG